MTKISIDPEKKIRGNFSPISIGENVELRMSYGIDGSKKSFHATAKQDGKEIARASWASDTRLFISVEPGVDADVALEIVGAVYTGLTMVNKEM